MRLYFISSNIYKFEEYCKLFNNKLSLLNVSMDEIQGTYEQVIENKIKTARMYLNGDEDAILVDDESLLIKGLYGFPGPYIKDFLKIGLDNILDIVEKVGNDSTALINLGFYYKGTTKIFRASLDGKIVKKRTGKRGCYGFDAVFCPKGDKTFSQMSVEEKNSLSHRGAACRKLFEYLKKNELFEKFVK